MKELLNCTALELGAAIQKGEVSIPEVTSLALEAAGRARMTRLLTASLICSYPQYDRLRAELARFEAQAEHTEFGADVELTLSLTPDNYEKFLPRVTELTSGTALMEVTGETLRPVRIEDAK